MSSLVTAEHDNKEESNRSLPIDNVTNKQRQCPTATAQQPSDREEQLILSFDVLDSILMDYLEKDTDVCNFIFASKIYYERFYDTLLLRNVLHGNCTALERAAIKKNKATMERMLKMPIIEKTVPDNVWKRTVNNARDRTDLVGLLLKVDCVRASIEEEAHWLRKKIRRRWKRVKFADSWLQVMHNAIESDQADVVKLFLSLGLPVESRGRDNTTALHMAAGGSEKASLVRLLLEKYKADPNKICVLQGLKRANPFRSPLTLAASKGHTEVVKLLLEHNADPCYGEAGGFCQGLSWAAFEGYEDIVSILMRDERIELNARDAHNAHNDYGGPLLGRAVTGGDTFIVQMLLENERIDPNATTADGKSPLLLAARGVGPFCRSSGLTMTNLLLSDNRVDVFLKDRYGRNALFHAAEEGQHQVLEMYLKDGRLDPNEGDAYRETPLLRTQNKECLQLLINDPRVDPNKENSAGITPLIRHVQSESYYNVERLLGLDRIDVNQTDRQGNTALIHAIGGCSLGETTHDLAFVQCMLDSRRVKLNPVNKYGETALMMAVKNNLVHVVEMILATGHRMVDIKDASGLTMIEHAAQRGFTQIVRLLLETGRVQVTQGIIEGAHRAGQKDIGDILERYMVENKRRMKLFSRWCVLQQSLCHAPLLNHDSKYTAPSTNVGSLSSFETTRMNRVTSVLVPEGGAEGLSGDVDG
ncbi:hypothetical protein MKX08_003734 [Trichoderma sp. CBMAI-0020]|nr:hypothetical protein MKX08_003734 [Trichoderma sp. CBMAI-0020]